MQATISNACVPHGPGDLKPIESGVAISSLTGAISSSVEIHTQCWLALKRDPAVPGFMHHRTNVGWPRLRVPEVPSVSGRPVREK